MQQLVRMTSLTVKLITPGKDTFDRRKPDIWKQLNTRVLQEAWWSTCWLSCCIQCQSFRPLSVEGPSCCIVKKETTQSTHLNTPTVTSWSVWKNVSEREIKDVFPNYSSSCYEECSGFDGCRSEIESERITWLGYSKQHTHMHTQARSEYRRLLAQCDNLNKCMHMEFTLKVIKVLHNHSHCDPVYLQKQLKQTTVCTPRSGNDLCMLLGILLCRNY